MKKILFILVLAFASVSASADFLEEILTGKYIPQTLSEHAMDSILGNLPNSRYRLEYTDKRQLFRHSFYANYVIVDTQKNTRKPLSDAPVRDAVMSPNGRYIAFVKADNNIYLHKLDFGTEVPVTASRPEEHIFNGISDWLYEEEFGKTCLMAFSPDSKQLAYIRLDDKSVPETSWQMMLGEGHPATVTQSYPRAGEHNARASVQIYTISNKDIQTPPVPLAKGEEGYYIPRIMWRSLPAAKKDQEPTRQLIVLTVNRDQNAMEVFSCNPASLVCTPLYEESSKDYYVDYSLFDQWLWLSDGRFIVLSEKDGWTNAYLHAAGGRQLSRLPFPAEGNMDITALYAFDEASQTLYLQAATTPATRDLYAVNIKKSEVTRLTAEEGMHSARFAADCKKMIGCYQSFMRPNSYTLYEVKGAKITQSAKLLGNEELYEKWAKGGLNEPTLIKIPNGQGQNLEAMYMLPASAKPEGDLTSSARGTRYPLVIMFYSGPASQRVLNRWRKRFEYALVEAGYAVLIVDTRGSDCQGRAWRNETYMDLGRKEAEDLIAAAQWACKQDYVDGSRISILGWSYGGYEVLRCMCAQPLQADGTPLIAKGVAIAPVTDWRLYDSGYTERYMRRPQVNEDGYNNADVTHLAKDLKGELLIVHGNADDNVHVQNTWRMVEALIDADKDYQMLVYPDDNHFLKQGNHYQHLHKQILKFLKK